MKRRTLPSDKLHQAARLIRQALRQQRRWNGGESLGDEHLRQLAKQTRAEARRHWSFLR